MAGASLLALLDDITTLLDDIALMTKTAAVKTAGVVSDDLAVNVERVSGAAAERELPIVLAVGLGSLGNKCILIPLALLLSAFAPRLITPLLMAGGAYLCYEGAEKVLHRFVSGAATTGAEIGATTDTAARSGGHDTGEVAGEAARAAAVPELEKKKIRGAVRTDFVLSTEIIIVALGTIPAGSPLVERAVVLAIIGVLLTAGVYGVVAAIVKLDDIGLYIARKFPGNGVAHAAGLGMVRFVPKLMRLLTVAGTLAMFTVGGGILAHGLHFFHYVADALAGLPLEGALDVLSHALLGFAVGAAIFSGGLIVGRLYRRLGTGG